MSKNPTPPAIGLEIERTTAPATTRSMHDALETLGLERLTVVHAGEESFPLTGGVDALACGRFFDDLEPLA